MACEYPALKHLQKVITSEVARRIVGMPLHAAKNLAEKTGIKLVVQKPVYLVIAAPSDKRVTVLVGNNTVLAAQIG